MTLTTNPEVTADLIAEAAAWLAVLHGPNRTATAERGFARWLKKSPAHAAAFEQATGIWEESRNLPRPQSLRRAVLPAPAPRRWFPRLVAMAALLALAAVGLALYLQERGVATNIGEQRVLVLEDGTRVILNTDTRVIVSYNRALRRIELMKGEALFEIAKKQNWPFVVTAGDRSIAALGTTFSVRRESQQVAVLLVEGKVAVSPASRAQRAGQGSDAVLLSPGERAVFVGNLPVRRDHPQVAKALAWQRHEVALDNNSLLDAVQEMNRYSRTPLVLQAVDAAQIRVTGLFRTGDSLSFARAVAEAYKLRVVEERGRIVLMGPPSEDARTP
jgi:transmembrane sensor